MEHSLFRIFAGMKLYIKSMVSAHCRVLVKRELRLLGLHFILSESGEVELMENISAVQRAEIQVRMHAAGFELLDEQGGKKITRIRDAVNKMFDQETPLYGLNFQKYISRELNEDYKKLSSHYSQVQGSTIEQFAAGQQISHDKDVRYHFDDMMPAKIPPADNLNFKNR